MVRVYGSGRVCCWCVCSGVEEEEEDGVLVLPSSLPWPARGRVDLSLLPAVQRIYRGSRLHWLHLGHGGMVYTLIVQCSTGGRRVGVVMGITFFL